MAIPVFVIGYFSCRGSRDYEVSIKDDPPATTWHTIASGTFPDPRACVTQELKVIKLTNATIGRYVRYWCKTYYGDGCSLQYVAVFQGNDL